jgi:pimeloyl-ACP methyl ester carboxylesterase
MAYEHRTTRVNSGDVTLFCRIFGKPGATPIWIGHGSNYYDSVDWIEVASALATDGEVVVPDRRGWGDSTWSPSKDYSLDALLDDILAVMRVMKWPKAHIMGHSGAGPTIISFAVNFPQMTEKLILVDSQMNREESARAGKSIGNTPYVFESVEAAMAKHKFSNPPRLAWDRKRAEQSLVKVEKGFMLKRDPDGGNRVPIGEGASLPRRPVREMWEELAMVKVPTVVIRGNRSSRYPAATVERLTIRG